MPPPVLAAAAASETARHRWWLAIPVLAPLLLGLVLVLVPMAFLAGITGQQQASAADSTACGPGGTAATVAGEALDAVQMGRAQTIADVAASMGLGPEALSVAYATAMQESRIRMLANDGTSGALSAEQAATTATSLDYAHDGIGNDHDSVNMFQQRWISGWGTVEQLMDPVYAATAFFEALLRVEGWEAMPITVAAQRVQVSAYPNAYARWAQLARELTGMLWPAAQSDENDAVCGGLSAPAGSWIRPTDGQVTSGFGPRGGTAHEGIDIAGPRDTPVYAAADGTVTRAECSSDYCDRDGSLSLGGYGNVVDIDHGDAVSTRYGHLSSFVVEAGQQVAVGTLIGYQGSTGNSTGVHLHFEVALSGEETDPMPFLAERGVDLTRPTAG